MRVVFTPSALFEMYDAGDWYENQLKGLGERFLLDVDTAVTRIADNPLQFPVIHKQVRAPCLPNFHMCSCMSSKQTRLSA